MKFPLQTTVLHPEHCDPLYLLTKLGLQHDYCALLESADRSHGSNDFSFLALGARDTITVVNGIANGSQYCASGSVEDPLSPFEQIIEPGSATRELFEMGYIGFLSYESIRFFESIDVQAHPDVPDAQFFLPEVLIRMNHKKHEVVVIAHKNTAFNLQKIEETIMQSPFFNDEKHRIERLKINLPTLEDIAPHRTVSREEHCKRVEKIKEQILEGEAFQVVLSQELTIEQKSKPEDIYAQLRGINPSPYMYYFQTPERVIVGASPETLVRVQDDRILYRPIAGTRKRTGDAEQDKAMEQELLSDQKERCEHQMLIDLGRNDVGKVAEIGTVEVQDPFHIERYSHVFHIVSDVYATLKKGLTSLDALRATFPVGTLTGAPKIRAMEIIRDTESSPRGIYGGAFGYIDVHGNIDFAIIIRTMLIQNGEISIRAGGGIVKDSVAELEDNECLHKARSCLAAVSQSTL